MSSITLGLILILDHSEKRSLINIDVFILQVNIDTPSILVSSSSLLKDTCSQTKTLNTVI